LEALSYPSLGALPSFGDGVSRKWSEGGRRENFWGREGGWKIPGQRKRMCFWFIPKTVWTASSWTGALVAAGSLQPLRGPYLPLFFPGAAWTCSVKCFKNDFFGWKRRLPKFCGAVFQA
jgi:hypothetical protein